jgi:hypothetical protein
MPRGGKRPGAGRPKGSKSSELPLVASLVDALKPQDGGTGPDRLRRRAIIALATMAARIEEIAAVVELSAEDLRRDFADEMRLGSIHRRCSLILNLDAAASGRGRRTPHVGAMIAMLRLMERADARDKREGRR